MLICRSATKVSAFSLIVVSIMIAFALLICGCSTNTSGRTNDFHFSLLKNNQTSIDFNNLLTEDDSVNFLINQYVYIGSGVGIADFNNDGFQDIFFAGEQVSCKLYLNKGDFKFEDITKSAGVSTVKWCTGVSIVDINNDGFPDIYVSVSHSRDPEQRKNLLFINNGNMKFQEQAAEYGLDDSGFSTQVAFFDYDKDGDLDMYQMNHNVFQNQPNNIIAKDGKGTSVAMDKLYRNEGILPGQNHSFFKDVTMEAGIKEFGYGLGLTISDFNKDGWPDIYVANDFLSNDLLWINNRNGTFSNNIASSMHHQSYNSMGVDAADINNDELPDVAVLDMQPETNYRKKTMFAGTNPEKYEMEQSIGGYELQFTRNMLQLHNGNRHVDSIQQPFFSEIGQLSGISETDWSWSVLMADFDNDGWKDIHVTNGIAKDLTNNDFLFFRSSQNGGEVTENNLTTNSIRSLRKELDAYGSIKIDNYFYHNNGDLTFSDKTVATGMDVPSVSHGAAYSDLDNDGDLDLVINNMNQEAFIWKNELRESAKDSMHNFLSIKFRGDDMNKSGIGAKATLYGDGKIQYLELYPVRGYLSSMDNRLYFGVGNKNLIDSLKIVWPDGLEQVLKNIKSNQLLVADHKQAHASINTDHETGATLFAESSLLQNIFFRHDESAFFDYGVQRLLPQKYSRLGPALATGDVNGDGTTDFFAGGASFQSGKIFIQSKEGTFSAKDLVLKNKTSEDIGAVFLDADGDKDLDLLITEGSTEYGNSGTLNVPRLYKNDGSGNFTLDESAIPSTVTTIGQTVTAGDYDNDGDADIFIGGRVVAGQYPLSPHSYILRNDKGKFTDATKEVCPALSEPGMITGAVWTDFDNDKKTDLVICGEWMPLRFFKNTNGKLEEITASTGLTNMNGLWRSLQAADIDKDGDMDFIAGNMGLNNKYHVSAEKPLVLYAKDIDGNGSIDMIPAYYIKNNKGEYELFPGIDRTEFAQQVLTIKKKYLLNEDFAKINMNDLLNVINKKDMQILKCETTSTSFIENLGKGIFKIHSLPVEAQFSPVNAIVANDFDKDGNIDLLLAGNEYQAEVGSGRSDASYGLYLKGNGKGLFDAVSPLQSGFILNGHIKGMVTIKSKDGTQLIIAAVNNDFLKCFTIKTTK